MQSADVIVAIVSLECVPTSIAQFHRGIPFLLHRVGPGPPLQAVERIHLVVGPGGGQMQHQRANGVCISKTAVGGGEAGPQGAKAVVGWGLGAARLRVVPVTPGFAHPCQPILRGWPDKVDCSTDQSLGHQGRP